MHPEQGRDSLERRPVAHARRHGNDRAAGQATDHAGQGALHSGHHDHDVGGGDSVDLGEQTVQAGDATVVDPLGTDAVGAEHGLALAGDGVIGGARRDDQHGWRTGIGWWRHNGSPHDRAAFSLAIGVSAENRGGLLVVDATEDHRRSVAAQELADDGHALRGRLAGGIDRLGGSLAQGPVMIDPGEPEIGKRQAAQHGDGVVGVAGAGSHLVEQ